MGLQIARSRSHLYTFGPKVGIMYIPYILYSIPYARYYTVYHIPSSIHHTVFLGLRSPRICRFTKASSLQAAGMARAHTTPTVSAGSSVLCGQGAFPMKTGGSF